MKFTEKEIAKMASPISETEEEKCKRAIGMVRDALKKLDYTDNGEEIRSEFNESYAFSLNMRKRDGMRIKLLVQGSYANNTNISSESDVDIAVILESAFIPVYREHVKSEDYNFSDGVFTVESLKDDVEKALKEYFGGQHVDRHDKSIKVSGNTYRVDADVVPAYRYRDYSNDYRYDENNYVGGILIVPDSGGKIINYPEQHIKNGIEKNKRTHYYYKKMVRIIKNMREELKDAGYSIPKDISSFGLESLLWNIDDSIFDKYGNMLGMDFQGVITFLLENTKDFINYKEANGIKKLFTSDSSLQQYNAFIDTLNNFFEYDAEG